MVLWWIGNVILLLVVRPGARRPAQPRARRARADPRRRPTTSWPAASRSSASSTGVPEAAGHDRQHHQRSRVGAVRYAGSVAKLLG